MDWTYLFSGLSSGGNRMAIWRCRLSLLPWLSVSVTGLGLICLQRWGRKVGTGGGMPRVWSHTDKQTDKKLRKTWTATHALCTRPARKNSRTNPACLFIKEPLLGSNSESGHLDRCSSTQAFPIHSISRGHFLNVLSFQFPLAVGLETANSSHPKQICDSNHTHHLMSFQLGYANRV